MKRILIYFFIITVVFSWSNEVYSEVPNPDLIIIPNQVNVTLSSVDFTFCNGKVAGSSVCFSLKKYLKYLEYNEQKYKVEIVTENNSLWFDNFDFDDEVHKIVPYFTTYKRAKLKFGDTLTISENANRKIDYTELGNEISQLKSLRVKLQFSYSQKTKAFFQPNSLIFPLDISDKRWLSNIKEIRIYKN